MQARNEAFRLAILGVRVHKVDKGKGDQDDIESKVSRITWEPMPNERKEDEEEDEDEQVPYQTPIIQKPHNQRRFGPHLNGAGGGLRFQRRAMCFALYTPFHRHVQCALRFQ